MAARVGLGWDAVGRDGMRRGRDGMRWGRMGWGGVGVMGWGRVGGRGGAG